MEMTLATLADIFGIIGFLVSLFAVVGVIKINKKISSRKMTVKDTQVGGDITGGNKNIN